MTSERNEIRAAGGVLINENGEVCIVHRPKHSDWTLPKGKLDDGEKQRRAAVREVLEETGIDAEIIRKVCTVHYATKSGDPKRVRYYLMRPISGEFTPNDEVDKIRWLAVPEALAKVSYDLDRGVIKKAVVLVERGLKRSSSLRTWAHSGV